MKKTNILAALALTGAALFGGAAFAEEPAPQNTPTQPAAEQPAPQQAAAQTAQQAERPPLIIRRTRTLPKQQEEAKAPAKQQAQPAVTPGNGKTDKVKIPGKDRPLKDWEKKYYEEHPEALKQDQERNAPPEGKRQPKNTGSGSDDEYYNWHTF